MGLFDPNSDSFHVGPAHRALVREIGLDARGVFNDPRIKPWRKLADRENCTLDVVSDDGKTRMHVKRYARSKSPTPADQEQAGHQLLIEAAIPAAPLIAWGVLTDGRSFTIWQDLSGFTPGDKLIERGQSFAPMLIPTADLAARLHSAGLHHRDLYLCHFMIDPVAMSDSPTTAPGAPVQLIDTARVRRLPGWPLRKRWIVKDLAQFWYSTTKLAISDAQREQWLMAYASRRGISASSLRGAILRKARAIRRHDVSLNAKEPTRNVSIPT